jgi:hypothetical protein
MAALYFGFRVQSDASTDVIAHLRHALKDVFYPHSHATDGFVGFDFYFAERMVAACFAH